MNEIEIFLRLGVALILGLLVGLQREAKKIELAGIRTFALVSLFGAVCGMLMETLGAWFPVAGLVAVGFAIVFANFQYPAPVSEGHPRTTTVIAALLVFAIGVYLMRGSLSVAMALGGTVAVLLYSKQPLKEFLARFGPGDLRAIIQFVLIALVILPLLPDENYGPYAVLNPHEAWFMVVLIVGISLGGYLAYQIAGAATGMLLGGLLGGLISSTATTVSYARQSKHLPDIARPAAFVIAAASTVVYARLLVEVAVVAPGLFGQFAPPLLLMLGTGACVAGYLFFAARRTKLPERSTNENPAELKAAIAFGVLYVIVLLAVAFARDRYGEYGIYPVAIISGLTDVDAITLSTARLVGAGKLSIETGWRAVLVASLANLGFKYGAVLVLGNRALKLRAAIFTGAMFLVGLPVLFLWPG